MLEQIKQNMKKEKKLNLQKESNESTKRRKESAIFEMNRDVINKQIRHKIKVISEIPSRQVGNIQIEVFKT